MIFYVFEKSYFLMNLFKFQLWGVFWNDFLCAESIGVVILQIRPLVKKLFSFKTILYGKFCPSNGSVRFPHVIYVSICIHLFMNLCINLCITICITLCINLCIRVPRKYIDFMFYHHCFSNFFKKFLSLPRAPRVYKRQK